MGIPRRRNTEDPDPVPGAEGAAAEGAEGADAPATPGEGAKEGDGAKEGGTPGADGEPPTKKLRSEEVGMTTLLTKYLVQSDPAEVLFGLKRLERMWYDDKQSCQSAADYGAPLCLISTMRKWDDNVDIIEAVCLCVGHMTYHLENVRPFFVELEAMEVATEAMKKFPHAAPLHEYACNLFNNLFLGSKGAQKKSKAAATKFVKDLNGLEVVVQSMKNFTGREHANVQMNGIAVLDELASNGFKKEVIASGAVREVAPIFDQKPRNQELVMTGKELMKRLFAEKK